MPTENPPTSQAQLNKQVLVRDMLLDAVKPYSLNINDFAIEVDDFRLNNIHAGDELRTIVNNNPGTFRVNTDNWEICAKGGLARRLTLVRMTDSICWSIHEADYGATWRSHVRDLMKSFTRGFNGFIMKFLATQAQDGRINFRNIGDFSNFTFANLRNIAQDVVDGGEDPFLALTGRYIINAQPTDRQQFRLDENGLFSPIYRIKSDDTHIAGFTGYRDGLLMANVLPAEYDMDLGFQQQTVIRIPEIGLNVLYTQWSDLKTRTKWAAIDTYFGISLGVPGRLELLGTDDTYKPSALNLYGLNIDFPNGTMTIPATGGTLTATVTSRQPVSVQGAQNFGDWLTETHTVTQDETTGDYVTTFTFTAAANTDAWGASRTGVLTLGNGSGFSSVVVTQLGEAAAPEPIVPEESGD